GQWRVHTAGYPAHGPGSTTLRRPFPARRSSDRGGEAGAQGVLTGGIRWEPPLSALERPHAAFESASISLGARRGGCGTAHVRWRSEEHTSELQSRFDLVCRLLLEKKK